MLPPASCSRTVSPRSRSGVCLIEVFAPFLPFFFFPACRAQVTGEVFSFFSHVPHCHLPVLSPFFLPRFSGGLSSRNSAKAVIPGSFVSKHCRRFGRKIVQAELPISANARTAVAVPSLCGGLVLWSCTARWGLPPF